MQILDVWLHAATLHRVEELKRLLLLPGLSTRAGRDANADGVWHHPFFGHEVKYT